MVEFEPPLALKPAQLGVILDESADTKDVTATIVDLAVRGFLTITDVPGMFGRHDWLLTQRTANTAELLPWLVPAAAAQVYAGVAASALAALDDYGTAAVVFAAGAVAGLAVIAAFAGHGVVAFGWGLALNGGIALGVPFAVLVARGGVALPTAGAARRLRELVEGVALPFALQGLYVIAYRFASGLGCATA